MGQVPARPAKEEDAELRKSDEYWIARDLATLSDDAFVASVIHKIPGLCAHPGSLIRPEKTRGGAGSATRKNASSAALRTEIVESFT